MKITQVVCSELALTRESATITCVGQRSKPGRGGGSFIGEKMGGFGCALSGGCWNWEACGK